MRRFTILFFLLLGICLPVFAEEYKFEMKGVKASLISEVKSIKPGQKFTVALYIQHFDDFHTYWKNPGLVGFATSIQWKLPKGFKAGEIQWQVPERSKMLKYNCHAYKGDTYLLIDIQAPEAIPEKFSIAAKVGGMSCSTKECCKIGYMDVEVELSKSTEGEYNVEAKDRIDKARAKLPVKNSAYSFKAARYGDKVILKVSHDNLESADGLYFYTDENITDTEKAQVFKLSGEVLEVVVPMNQYAGQDLKTFKGLLFSEKGWGSKNQQYLLVECVLD